MKQVWINTEAFGKPDSHLYNLSKVNRTTVMSTSDNAIWLENNKDIMTIEDSGDDITIRYADGKRSLTLTYSQALEMFVLLAETIEDRVEIKESVSRRLL